MEIWKEVIGWNGKYLISDHGRFKSVGGKYKNRYPDGYITDGFSDTSGYKSIVMRRPKHMERIRIHTLVGNHFLQKPKCNSRLVINHKDGNKHNNHYTNLEWVTPRENSHHAIRTGLFNLKGENHPHVKLNKDQVIEMRRLRKTGLTHEKIGKMFGVCRRQAGDVINGVNWGWLQEGL